MRTIFLCLALSTAAHAAPAESSIRVADLRVPEVRFLPSFYAAPRLSLTHEGHGITLNTQKRRALGLKRAGSTMTWLGTAMLATSTVLGVTGLAGFGGTSLVWADLIATGGLSSTVGMTVFIPGITMLVIGERRRKRLARFAAEAATAAPTALGSTTRASCGCSTRRQP